MKYFLSIIILGGLVFTNHSLLAQARTITWLSPKIVMPLNKGWSTAFRPIERYDLDNGKHIDISIDLSATKSFNKIWSARILYRHFFVPQNSPDRNFIFLDLIHKTKLGKFNLSNRWRYHWAFDINVEDVDFLRWIPTITYPLNNKKLSFMLGFDWFYRPYTNTDLAQVRYMAGFNWKLSTDMALNFQYWRQNTLDRDPPNNFNILVLTLSYTLRKKQAADKSN